MTVRELLARTDARELAEWQAYEREFGPLGPERGDVHSALISHTMASALNTGKTRFRLADFLPRWSRRRRQTSAQQLAVLRAFAARQEHSLGNNR